MKTFFSTTTLILTAALSPLVSAKNQCEYDLPSETSYERNYVFTREGGGEPTKCSGSEITEHKSVNSAEDCASTCASADEYGGTKDGFILLGYNFNCRNHKCDCIRGNKWDDLDRNAKEASGSWSCYKSDNAAPTPTPPPTPAQCELPGTTTGSADGESYTFTKGWGSGTSCDIGESFLPVQVDNVEECANECAERKQELPYGKKTVIGFDFSCDTMKCTCLEGYSGTNLRDTVQNTNANMACYIIGQDAQMEDTKNYLRANVIQSWE